MPPKKSGKGLDIIKGSGEGRTKQQREEDELKMMQQLAENLFASVHQPKPAAKASGKSKKAVAMRQKSDEDHAAQRQALEQQFELAHQRVMEASVYVNEPVELTEGTTWFSVGKNKWIRYAQFVPEYLEPVVQLLTVSLSEPYNAFTYKYFLSGWPDLGIVAFGVDSETEPAASEKGTLIGTAISKVSRKQPSKPLRGYIAMLAVAESFRGLRLGQRLVTLTVDLMKRKKVQEVCLETPTSNDRALQLYLGLGFVKHKFLTRYYLDGQDAVRLKLWLASAHEPPAVPDALKDAMNNLNRTATMIRQLEYAGMVSGHPGLTAVE